MSKTIKNKLINGIFYMIGSLSLLGLFIATILLWKEVIVTVPTMLLLFYLGALWSYCTIFSVGNFVKYADLKRQEKESEQNGKDTDDKRFTSSA